MVSFPLSSLPYSHSTDDLSEFTLLYLNKLVQTKRKINM